MMVNISHDATHTPGRLFPKDTTPIEASLSWSEAVQSRCSVPEKPTRPA
jgi:hypothetical protein